MHAGFRFFEVPETATSCTLCGVSPRATDISSYNLALKCSLFLFASGGVRNERARETLQLVQLMFAIIKPLYNDDYYSSFVDCITIVKGAQFHLY
jgi:hypothetical protein